MRLEEECRFSYYQQIAALKEEHGVYLVQHLESKGIFVKKILELYNAEIFRYDGLQNEVRHPDMGKIIAHIETFV